MLVDDDNAASTDMEVSVSTDVEVVTYACRKDVNGCIKTMGGSGLEKRTTGSSSGARFSRRPTYIYI
jgi:hypothetical protein